MMDRDTREQRLLVTTGSAHREEEQICREREGPFREERAEGERRREEEGEKKHNSLFSEP